MHRHSKYQSTTTEYRLEEHHLYGSSRLGMEQYVDDTLYYGQTFSLLGNSTTTVTPLTPSNDFAETQAVGAKQFELTDHRGNVNVVVSDRKLSVEDGSTGNTDYYTADVVSYADYYPFGMQMIGRNGNSSTYRYGFQNQEKDDEVKGSGNHLNFGARCYDSRLGRWMSLDPLAIKYPDQSPYNFVVNSPLLFIDPDGKEVWIYYIDEKGNEQHYVYSPGEKPKVNNTFVQKVHEAYMYNTHAEIGRNVWSDLNDPETVTAIRETQYDYWGDQKGTMPRFEGGGSLLTEDGRRFVGTIYWDPDSQFETWAYDNGIVLLSGYLAPSTQLIHEAGHAQKYKKNPIEMDQDYNTPSGDLYDNLEERRNIKDVEVPYVLEINQYESERTEGNKAPIQQGIRENHQGQVVPVGEVGVNEIDPK